MMKHIRILRDSFGQVWRYRRMLWLLYAMVLGSALLIAWPVRVLLVETAGHSLALERLLEGLDYTFWMDLLREYGVHIQPVLQSSILVVLVFAVVMVFLLGGILATLQAGARWDGGIFWKSCGAFFWRLLRLTVYFWLLHAIVLGIMGWTFVAMAGGISPAAQASEVNLANGFFVFAPFYILVAAFCWMWQDYAKVEVVRRNSRWIYGAIWGSFRFALRHFWLTYPVFLMTLLLLALIGLLHWWWYPVVEEQSTALILLSFVMAQFVILVRLYVRLMQWGSATLIRNLKT
jgi:hypothetical protein